LRPNDRDHLAAAFARLSATTRVDRFLRGALVVKYSGHTDRGAVVTGAYAVGGVVREVAVKDPVTRVVRGELQLVKVAGVDGLGGLADLWDSVAVFGHHDFVVSMQMHGVGLLGSVVNADPDPIALLDRDGSA